MSTSPDASDGKMADPRRTLPAGVRQSRPMHVKGGRAILRRSLILASLTVALFGLIAAAVLARGGPPPPDATPGTAGISGVPLGGVDPAVAPGYRLELIELTW